MEKVTCVVLDDEELARDLLKSHISQVPDLHLLASLKKPVDALSLLNSENVDLLFLDIQMPGLTGLDFLNTLTNPPGVIFTTAYREYALEGYRYNAIDYLLKPIEFKRFIEAVNNGFEYVANKRKLMSHIKPVGYDQNGPESSILVKSERKILRLMLKDIMYIEGMAEYVAFHTNAERILSLVSLKKLEEDLPQSMFLRVHKSFIVNKNYVTGIDGNILMLGNKRINIGASYKVSVMKNIFES